MAQQRLAELLAAVSLATDLGTGQPLEHAVRTTCVSVRAAEALGATADERSTALYVSLLRFLGCTADASASAAVAGGDEVSLNRAMASVVMADDREALPRLVRSVGAGLAAPTRARLLVAALTDPGGKARTLTAHCEVGARLAARIGLPERVTHSLAHGYERWDGKGLPSGLAGTAIPLAVRLAVAARDLDLWSRVEGPAEATAMLRRRRGRAYDPEVVDVLVAEGPAWIAELDAVDPWDLMLSLEPAPEARVGAEGLDALLEALADFADLKSPWFGGHSRSVSTLAAEAARTYDLDDDEVIRARRVGLVHDLGIVGVPSGVWNHPGALTVGARDRVHSHAQLGEQILSKSAALKEPRPRCRTASRACGRLRLSPRHR